jgi:hypothetical protein
MHILRVASLVTLLFIGGCTQPIYNVERHPTPLAARTLTADEMERAIVQAAQAYGWSTDKVGPGTLRATHTRQQHTAVVDVRYTEQDYSIQLNNTANLKQSGSSVHHVYNLWVRNLEAEIERRLNAAAR